MSWKNIHIYCINYGNFSPNFEKWMILNPQMWIKTYSVHVFNFYSVETTALLNLVILICFPCVSSVHTQRRGLHSYSVRRIQQLEERANAEEHNPRVQAEYLRVSFWLMVVLSFFVVYCMWTWVHFKQVWHCNVDVICMYVHLAGFGSGGSKLCCEEIWK